MKIRSKVALTTALYLVTLSVVFYFAGKLLIFSNVDSIQAHFNAMPDYHNVISAELNRLKDFSLISAKDSRTIEFLENAPESAESNIPVITARDGQVISDKQLDLFVIATMDGFIRAGAINRNGEIQVLPDSIHNYISPENNLLLTETAAKKTSNFAGIFAMTTGNDEIHHQYLVSVVPIYLPEHPDAPAGVLVFGRDIENLPKIGKSITYFGKRPIRDKSASAETKRPLYKPFVNEIKISNHSKIDNDELNDEDGDSKSVVSIPLRDFYGNSYAQINLEYKDATQVIENESESRLRILLGVTAVLFFIPIFLINIWLATNAVRSMIKQTDMKAPALNSWDAEDAIQTIVKQIETSESELKEIKAKYELSELTLASIQNAVAGTIIIYHDNGEIVHCHLSPGKNHLSKLVNAIAKGKNVKEAKGLKDDAFKREIQAVDAASKHGGCHIIQTSTTDDNGAIIWFESRITRIKHDLILAQLEDITVRKTAGLERSKMDEKIKDIEKAETFGILAGGLAHDYNNMLTAMLGNIDLLLCGQLLPQTRDALSDVRVAMLRAAALVRRMLSYAGKSGPILEDTNLCSLVADITRLMRRSIPDNAKIILDTPETTPVVRVDSTQIWQVLMNLIINGCDSMEGMPGTVRVTTSGQELSDRELSIYNSREPLAPGWYACIEVEDTGKGMDDPTIARIFEPFFTTKPNGKGLGLPSVINIIYSYNGGITLRSTAGRGTVFKIVIPARLRSNGEVLLPGTLKKRLEEKAKTDVPSILKHDTQSIGDGVSVSETQSLDVDHADEKGKQDAPPVQKKTGKASILIVDDDSSILKLLKLILKSGGYDVIESASGKEGLKTYEKAADSIDLCLMDVSMGAGMSGLELCAEIRKRNPDIPVILMSAYRAKEMSSKMSAAGVSGFLAKPFRGTDVLDLVKNYLKNQQKQTDGGSESGTIC